MYITSYCSCLNIIVREKNITKIHVSSQGDDFSSRIESFATQLRELNLPLTHAEFEQTLPEVLWRILAIL